MVITIVSSLICLGCGIYIGKLISDYKWSHNAFQPYHIEHDGLLYKVHCDRDSAEECA